MYMRHDPMCCAEQSARDEASAALAESAELRRQVHSLQPAVESARAEATAALAESRQLRQQVHSLQPAAESAKAEACAALAVSKELRQQVHSLHQQLAAAQQQAAAAETLRAELQVRLGLMPLPALQSVTLAECWLARVQSRQKPCASRRRSAPQ